MAIYSQYYIPYFYVIQDVRNDMYYAGSKYGQDANPSNFMIEGGYETSSETIKELIHQHGFDNFIIRKVRTFETGDEAYRYEKRFLIRVNAKSNPRFYNKHNNEFNAYGSQGWIEAMIREFGVPYPTQSNEIQEKSKKTCLERYGVEYSFQSDNNKDKAKETWLERYGVDNPAKSDEIQKKSKETCLVKYGVEYSFQSDNNINKSKETCMERYGVEYTTQVKEINDRRVESRNKTISDPEWKNTIGKEASKKRMKALFGSAESARVFSDKIKKGLENMSEDSKENRKNNLSKNLTRYFSENKTMWINDGEINKVINVNDKDKFIQEGWEIGRVKGKFIWINDGHENKRIKIEHYNPSSGWIRGRISKGKK